jgi:hypothetical protein
MQKLEVGSSWIRVVGEPVWAGCSDAEINAWIRYESLINLMFAPLPATIICPYDMRSVPREILADACRTHPEIAQSGGVGTPSPTYCAPEDLLLEQ